MAVQNRPNDPPLNDLTWAESGPSAIENSESPAEPPMKVTGYGNQEVLPHAQFNWLIRSMMRWIRWLVSKVDGHVHDGGTSAGSVTKVNATNHLDWGANGTFETTMNTSFVHEITHGGNASNKRIVTNQLHAPTHVRTTTIQANGTGTAAPVNVRDIDGNHGLLNSATLQTSTIRATTSGTTAAVNVRDNNGILNGLLDSATVRTNTIRRQVSGTGVINVRDRDGTDNTRIDARNVPYALAHVNGFGTPSYRRNYNFEASITRITNLTTGAYALSFVTPADKVSDDAMIFVNPIGNGLLIDAKVVDVETFTNALDITFKRFFLEVKFRNTAGTLQDSGFSIAVYLH